MSCHVGQDADAPESVRIHAMDDNQAYPNHPKLTDTHPLAAPVIFLHETSVKAAVKILRTRIFVCDASRNDGGLNGELPDRTVSQQGAEDGAVLTFEWAGPIVQVLKLADNPAYAPNILYEERPYRVFVPGGTTRHLRLTKLALQENGNWAEALADPPRPTARQILDPGAWYDWCKPAAWRAARLAELQNEIEAVEHTRPAMRVVRPNMRATPDDLAP